LSRPFKHARGVTTSEDATNACVELGSDAVHGVLQHALLRKTDEHGVPVDASYVLSDAGKRAAVDPAVHAKGRSGVAGEVACLEAGGVKGRVALHTVWSVEGLYCVGVFSLQKGVEWSVMRSIITVPEN